MANKEQSDSMEDDEREGLVRDYLNTLLPTNWHEMEGNDPSHIKAMDSCIIMRK